MSGILHNKHPKTDQVWHVQITMIIAIVLQLALPDTFSFGSRYILPVIEGLLLLALTFTTPREQVFRSITRRINAFLLIAIATVANGHALGAVADQLLKGGHVHNGRELILAAL